MKIDHNPVSVASIEAFHNGDRELGHALEDAFVAAVNQTCPDICTCPKKCKNHGNCQACVARHTHNKSILPHCLRASGKKQLARLCAFTEDTFREI